MTAASSELVIDSFAGGGGASEGIRMALGRDPDIALNHDQFALALRRVNQYARRPPRSARSESRPNLAIETLDACGSTQPRICPMPANPDAPRLRWEVVLGGVPGHQNGFSGRVHAGLLWYFDAGQWAWKLFMSDCRSISPTEAAAKAAAEIALGEWFDKAGLVPADLGMG